MGDNITYCFAYEESDYKNPAIVLIGNDFKETHQNIKDVVIKINSLSGKILFPNKNKINEIVKGGCEKFCRQLTKNEINKILN